MSLVQRINLIAGALLAALVCFVAYGGVTQQASTQTEGAVEQPSFAAPDEPEFVPGEVIVGLEESATQADLAALNQRTDARTEEDLPLTDANVVDLPQDLSVGDAVQRYEASPDVEFAEPNFLVYPSVTPNEPEFDKLWGLHNTGQTIEGSVGTSDADADVAEAWDTSTGSPDTVVAVIDTGIDIRHPDLNDNIWTNPAESGLDDNGNDKATNGVDDDGNGNVDDVHGWDFLNDDASVYDPNPTTGKGENHGTHVAGIIAAEGNNGVGITGVNWQAEIMPLKIFGPKGAAMSDAVKALNYAVKNGAKISNNSWGGSGDSQALRDAIKRADAAGHLFVAAAGNGGSDKVGDNNDRNPSYPASYNSPNVVSVAATDSQDRLARFSNFGVKTVDLAAPGVSIYSTLPGNRYEYLSGTSMATPHVAGVAALLKSVVPELDDTRMKCAILNTVDKKATLTGKVLTNGRLNAANALASVDPTSSMDSTDPTVTSVRPFRTRDRTPTIAATVSDDCTELAQGDITFALDGQARDTFSYDTSTDRLVYNSGRLALGAHTVEITATDAAGNAATKPWTFKVLRRR